jgi:tetratricopeptide (TPR) repeat protein
VSVALALLDAVGAVGAGAQGPGTKPAAGPAPVSAANRPLTADEALKGREVFDQLLQQGTNALAAGEYPAALEALQDAKQIFDQKLRGRGVVAVGGPEHVALLHGLALAYQLVNKPERASPLFENNSPLDRACSSKGVSRQLLLTRGVLDATQGYLAMRTAVSLTNYLKEHPDELDSELLDLMFTALRKAEDRVTNRALQFEPMVKLYEDFNKRLESTRPGERRWGVQWVDQKTFDEEMKRRKAALKRWEDALAKADEAGARVSDAQASVEQARRGSVKNRGALTAALNRLAQAKSTKANLDAKAEEVRQQIPPVPTLSKDDFARILTPKDVDVVVTGKAKAGGTEVAAAGGAEGTRSVKFSLGGTAAKPPVAAGPIAGGGVATAPRAFEPVTPTPTARRTFARSATGFAIGPDLLLTAASAVKGAKRVTIEFTGGQSIDATVERTEDEGLALLKVQGQKMAYVNLATAFDGGPVRCPAFPEVSVFGVNLETIQGRAVAAKDDGWQVALGKHPRLPGAPLLDAGGNLVGVEMANRDDAMERLPALPLGAVKAFLAADAPGQPCANPQVAAVVQITATFEK